MKSRAEKQYQVLLTSIIVFAVLSVGLLLAGFLFLRSLSGDLAKSTTEAKYLNDKSEAIANVIQRYWRVASYDPIITETVPDTKDLSSFIDGVSKIATGDSMVITSSQVVSSSTKSTNPNYSQTISQSDYYELQIKYAVTGSYSNFLKFLGDLDSLRRLNAVSNVSVIKSQTDKNGDAVSATFTDSIYIKK